MQGLVKGLRKLIVAIPPISIVVLFIVLMGFMLILGLLIYRVLNVPDTAPGMQVLTVHEKLALIVILAWMALLIAYYSWQVYFYNYSYGRSSEFWTKFILRSREESEKERKEEIYKTEAQLYEELGAPKRNPFYDQTFGLPPGTVRGTLALTVMVGGLCLLILLIGGSKILAAYPRQMNFFEQAFLMVMAFYFGTKGFEIMQQEQTKRMMAATREGAGTPPAPAAAPGEMEEPVVATVATVPLAPAVAEAPDGTPVKEVVVKTGTQSEVLVKPETVVNKIVVDKEVIGKNIVQHYPHVTDLEETLYLQPDHIQAFAQSLGLEVPAVRAVIEIEASGKGFLKDGRPKILFEGHVFWRRLKVYKINPAQLAAAHPSIIYPTWTRQHYLTGTLEYKRLNEARSIHDSAALESASWGLFQIMGYHARKMGYKTVQEFVRRQEKSEAEQLEAFGKFITQISPPCLNALKAHDWATFAKHYNGIQFAKNQYDVKLKRAYDKYAIQFQVGQPQEGKPLVG